MPTIQSKKFPDDEHTHFVDSRAWEEMKRKGLDRRYNIIDNGDIAQTIEATPEKIVEFASPEKPVSKIEDTVKPLSVKLPISELSKNDIVIYLREYNIPHTARESKKDLYEKYLNN